MDIKVIKMIRDSKDFSNNPIKLICDNMIIVWDNVPDNPGLIWDDANECVIWLYPNSGNTDAGQVSDSYPFRLMYIPYEMIQYIDVLMSPTDAHKFIQNNKDEMLGNEDQINRMYKNVMGNRSYTGSISEYPHRVVHPRIGE